MTMGTEGSTDRRRAATFAGVALLHAGVAFLVLAGTSAIPVPIVTEALTVFEVPEPAPPAPELPAKPAAPKPEGAASAASRKARPKPVLAPPPAVKLEAPVAAPPIASTGPDASGGAANVEGPGTGAAGAGLGLGSGGEGAGTGGGGGASARWRKGRIKDSDYPRGASRAKIGGTVTVTFTVGTDGRTSDCRVVTSSGNAELDVTTCRLIEKRFRYEPARNARGEPVASVEGWRQTWWLEDRD